MIFKSRFALLASVLLTITSCTTVSYSTQFSKPGFQIQDLLNKKITVVPGNEMYRTDYDRAFEKRFTDNDGYFRYAQLAFAEELKNINPNVNTSNAEGLEALSGLNSLSDTNIQRSRKFLENSDSDFIVIIKGARIKQEIQHNYAPPVQPGMAGGNSSKESCIVTIILSIWDTRSQNKVYEFSTTDKVNVVFFTYQASLEDATQKAIESAISYIQKNGRVK